MQIIELLQVLEIKELIRECISENPLAQKELYERYAPKMYPLCLQYANDEEEAKDVLQEGFIKIFGKLKQFKEKGSFEGWMRRIFINSALEKYRNKINFQTIDEKTEQLTGGVPEKIIDQLSANDLLTLIRELSPQYRLVFNLYAIEGYSHKEISRKLKISEGTSKSNLSRARNILQSRIKGETGTQPIEIKKSNAK